MKGLCLLFIVLCCFQASAFIKKESVSFQSGSHRLSGTALIPKGPGPFPAVVFLHGSGAATRDQNKWRAKKFTQQGYISLIFDKRGAGESQGSEEDWRYFSFDSLAQDAIAAVDYLCARKDVNPDQIGLIAASQSGWVAPIAAVKSKRISFMILISASVSTVAEDRIFERSERLKHEGFNTTQRSEVMLMQKLDHNVTRNPERFPEFETLWTQNQSKAWFPRVYPSDYFLQDPASSVYRKWFRNVLDFDPVPFFETLKIPIFWLFGDPALDRFGPVEKSVEQVNNLIASGKPFQLIQYEGADHNLKGAAYFEDMFDWLNGNSH